MARVIVEIRTGSEVLRFENTANKNRWGAGRLTELRAVVETLESITAEVRAIVRASDPATAIRPGVAS